MDQDSKAKLNRLLRRQRLRSIVPAFALSAVVLALFALYFYDQGASDKMVTQATVQSWSRAQTDQGSGAYLIWVELEDGTKVLTKASRNGRAPVNGEKIQIEKAKSRLGRVSYRWNR